MRFFPTVIVLTIYYTLSFGQNFNRPVPLGFPQYEFTELTAPTSSGSYLLTPIFPAVTSNVRQLYAINTDGYLQWYAGNGQNVYVNFDFHKDANLFSFASNANPTSTMKFYVMNSNFELIDSVVPAFNYSTDIHEFRILNNGNYLITAVTQTEEDLTGYTFGNNQGVNPTTVVSFVLQEFENGNLIFDWKSIDHIDPSEFNSTFNYYANSFDYVHGNAVEEDAEGNFLISMRHTNAIYKIDRSTGNVIWTLGGVNSDFQFVNDNGFSGQHDVRILANGNITLFDNGNSNPPPRSSRAVEYELELQNMTATKVWEYYNEFNSYSGAMGSFRTYNNGDKLVGYGAGYRPAPSMILLNYQDEVVTEISLKDSVFTYRAVRADFTPTINAPEISCSSQNNEIVLTATSGYDQYRWNTGETSQSIMVSELGTYQVWTTGGIGFIGSQPFFLEDLGNPCSVTSIVDESSQESEIELIWNSETNEMRTTSFGNLTIVNSLGQTVYESQAQAGLRLNLSFLPLGVYIAKLNSEFSNHSILRFYKN